MSNEDRPHIVECIAHGEPFYLGQPVGPIRTFVGPFPTFGDAHRFMECIDFSQFDVILIHTVHTAEEMENDGKMRRPFALPERV